MHASYLTEINKEIDRLKRHISSGHSGSVLEPRDYGHELNNALEERQKASELLKKLEGCTE
jgi:hypothetical protein